MPQLTRFASLTAALVVAASAFAVGCSLLVDSGGLVGPADGAAPFSEGGASPDSSSGSSGGLDSGGTDSSTTADGPVIEGDGSGPGDPEHVGPNLLADHSFESGCTWNGFQGVTTTESPTAHTGTKSCRVCTEAATTDYFTAGDPFTFGPPVVGVTYRATAWVRTAPGASTPPGAVMHLRTSNPAPFASIESAYTSIAGLPFTPTWQKMVISLKVSLAAAKVDVFVGTDTAPGACFLIDDVWLEQLPGN
jgi:hypothetical protein